MTQILLDTCIIVDHLRSRQIATDFIQGLHAPPCISSVTVMELYAGVKGTREGRQLDLMIAHANVQGVTGEIGVLAGKYLNQYRPSNGLDVIDALIAATSKINGIQLATLNIKHFPMFEELKRPY